MIVDFHTHIFPPEVISERERFLDDDNFRILYSSRKSAMADHEALMSMMNSSGIDYAVAMSFPWFDEGQLRSHNEYMAHAWKESGGRIIPFMTAPPGGDVAGEVAVLKRLGAAGIGEVAFYGSGFGPVEEKYLTALFDAAMKAKLPVCLHVNEPVGHPYDGKYEPSLDRLYGVIREFPGLTLILSHWGGGLFFYELMPEVRKVLARVYYDTAASPYLYDSRVYAVAREIIGDGKIIFGTDYPLLGAERYLPSITANFSEASAQKVLSGNAREILGL